MPRSTPLQSSFNGGEISPRVQGRQDLDRYRSSAAQILNFVPLVQGPAMRRSGTRFVAQTLGSDIACLIPFEVADDDAVMIAITDGKMRFYEREAVLLSGGVPVEVAVPYLESELFEIQYAQFVDVLYLVHPAHAPQKLTRTGPTTFTLATVTFFDGPFNAVAVDRDGAPVTTTLAYAAGASGATITVTASAALFAIEDVGRQIRLGESDNTDWGFGTITVFTSATSVDVLLERAVTMQTATTFWRLGAFYTGNFPQSITFDDQRLFLGADPEHPQTVYGSVVGDFENFTLTGETSRSERGQVTNEVTADNSLRLTLSANNLNTVRWLFSLRALVLATSQGFWSIQASSNIEPLQPANAGARRANDRGGAAILPKAVESSTVYVSASQRRLYRARFAFEDDTFESSDLSVIADHLPSAGIRQIAWAGDPTRILWAVTEDGRLLGVTLDEQQQALAWHQHVLGGDDVAVESVAVIPAPEGAVTVGARENRVHDQLWLVVRRTINGTTYRAIEFLEDFFSDDDLNEEAYFVDMGKSYAGSGLTTLTGLGHLEGETVVALADGSLVTGLVVSGGQVTLATPADLVHVGLAFLSRVRTLPLVAGDPEGSSQGKHKRTDHVTVRFDRSQGGRIGGSDRTLRRIPYPNDPLSGSPPPLFSGDLTVGINTGWTTTATLDIETDDPKPMTIISVAHRVESHPRGTH